jgi:hypothetical protein
MTPIICAALDRYEAWERTVTLRSDAEAAAFLRRNFSEHPSVHAPSLA